MTDCQQVCPPSDVRWLQPERGQGPVQTGGGQDPACRQHLPLLLCGGQLQHAPPGHPPGLYTLPSTLSPPWHPPPPSGHPRCLYTLLSTLSDPLLLPPRSSPMSLHSKHWVTPQVIPGVSTLYSQHWRTPPPPPPGHPRRLYTLLSTLSDPPQVITDVSTLNTERPPPHPPASLYPLPSTLSHLTGLLIMLIARTRT